MERLVYLLCQGPLSPTRKTEPQTKTNPSLNTQTFILTKKYKTGHATTKDIGPRGTKVRIWWSPVPIPPVRKIKEGRHTFRHPQPRPPLPRHPLSTQASPLSRVSSPGVATAIMRGHFYQFLRQRPLNPTRETQTHIKTNLQLNTQTLIPLLTDKTGPATSEDVSARVNYVHNMTEPGTNLSSGKKRKEDLRSATLNLSPPAQTHSRHPGLTTTTSVVPRSSYSHNTGKPWTNFSNKETYPP